MANTPKRADAINAAMQDLFDDFEGNNKDEKLENIRCVASYLAAMVGGYNLCAASDNFEKGQKFDITPETFTRIFSISDEVFSGIESLIKASLFDADLQYSQAWFYDSCTPTIALSFAKARSLTTTTGDDPEFLDALIKGLVSNLASCLIAHSVPRVENGTKIDTSIVTEEVQDSIVSDFNESFNSTILRLQDKWGSYFSARAASKPTRNPR